MADAEELPPDAQTVINILESMVNGTSYPIIPSATIAISCQIKPESLITCRA